MVWRLSPSAWHGRRQRSAPGTTIAQTCAAQALVSLLVAILLLSTGPTSLAQEAAEAASGPPLTISLFVNSGSTVQCYGDGRLPAIRKLTELARDDINKRGGIHGRPVAIQILDNTGETEKTIANMKAALAAPRSLAMVGLSNNFLARKAFETLKDEIQKKKIPFITSISSSPIFDGFNHVFSTEPSRLREGLPIIEAFIRHLQLKHVGFIGRADADSSREVGGELWARLRTEALVWDKRIDLRAGILDPSQLKEAVGRVGKTVAVGDKGDSLPTEMLVVDLAGSQAAELLKNLRAAKTAPPIFLTGAIDDIPRAILDVYPNAIYELAWDELPEVYNNHIVELVGEERPQKGFFAGEISLDRLPEVYENRIKGLVEKDSGHQWVFTGEKQPASPGWDSGFCKERPQVTIPDPLGPQNLKAIDIGAQFADMVNLVTTAARTAGARGDLSKMREAIRHELGTTYTDGKGAYKGRLRNWSFDPHWRTASRRPFVVILPQGLGRKQLAPVQFARAKKRKLRQIETLYIDVDLVRAHSVDDNRKSFLADFYIAMRGGANGTIENLDFANAYLDPRTGGRQLTIQTLHPGGPSDVYPSDMQLYRVSGRFLFDPKLSNYPFDSQLFTIDLQPKSGTKPFIVQPPPLRLRDKELTTDGWTLKHQYVGYSADFVPVVDAFTHTPSIVPFYTASFVWKMKRETTDYFLRVVVPLAFILIVAYLSIFIPQSHLEAIVTIQITALLSAVALYLSLPKLEADTATISDRIFVFDYMMVSFMIVISILRINQRIAKRKWLDNTLSFIHIALIPAIVLAMIYSVYQVSTLQS